MNKSLAVYETKVLSFFHGGNMLKHVIDALTNTYYIIKDDVIVFSIDLKEDKVDIRGCMNVYKGDIEVLKLEKSGVPSEE